jgi:rod shape determining protein RodA
LSSILLLVITEIIGHKALGAQRWLKLGYFSLQPSEIVKITTLNYIIGYLSQNNQIGIKQLLISSTILVIPLILILRQPNLGTAMILILCFGVVLFIAGLHLYYFIGGVLIVFILSPLLWSHLHHYQQQRILSFIYPDKDPLGASYNIIQSKIAIGSGGLYGKGFMQGTQTHLSFLPEKHTDFIVAVLGEEYGFIGVIGVLSLYFILILIIYKITFIHKNSYEKLMCISIASLLFFHIFINISVVTGIIPATGLPMPFLSFGGSNMIVMSWGLSMVISSNTNIIRIYAK